MDTKLCHKRLAKLALAGTEHVHKKAQGLGQEGAGKPASQGLNGGL